MDEDIDEDIDEVIDLSVCRLHPPATIAAALTDSAQTLLDLIGCGHDTAGLPPLRSALAQHLTDQGLPTHPTQLLITTGSQQALALIATDLEPNDRVMIEDPTYFGALHAYLNRNVRLVPMPLDRPGWRTDPAPTSRRVSLVHVTSAVHNPTGRQLNTSTGERLVALAGRLGATLVDDQALRYLAEHQPPFLAAHDLDADIMTIGSFSKVLWSALRVGWLRAPAPTIARLGARKAALDIAGPALDQALVLHCLPQLEELATQRRQELAQKRAHLRHRLQQDLPQWQDATGDSGPFLWVRTHLEDASDLVHAAARAHVALTPGHTLTPTTHWNSFVRIAVTAPDAALDSAVRRITRSLEQI